MSATAVASAVASPPVAADPRLAMLRERIATVRQARARVRRLTALVTVGLAVVGVLVAAFTADWLLALPRSGRAVSLALAAGALGWTWLRHVRPWLDVRESDLDLALLVEKQQGLDSDLVAALQFESPEARGWGSGDLRAAVIDYVGEFGREWEVPRQVAGAMLRRRGAWLAGGVAMILAAAVLRPDFAVAFLNRFVLGSMHYPTRTRFESLTVAGRPVRFAASRRQQVASPVGQPFAVEAVLAGAVPESGSVRFSAVSGGPETTLELSPDSGPGAGRFAARLPRLLEPVDVQVLAGDAWTDPIRVDVVPAPIIETTLTAEPPEYARDAAAQAAERRATNVRQMSVIEGSRVGLLVTCANKPLGSAVLVIDGQEFPLVRAATGGAWELPAGGSPLARVVEPLQFELRVQDADGLGPERPITGSIRIKADAPPQVTADVQTRLALPTATPVLDWQVRDDYGIAEVSLLVEPFPADAEGSPRPAEPRTIRVADIPAGGHVDHGHLPLAGRAAVPLAALGLAKGDQVRLTLKAVDYRGGRDGREVDSAPIVLEVTDEAGLLASFADDDERSVRQIDAILERELEVGGAVRPAVPPPGRGEPR